MSALVDKGLVDKLEKNRDLKDDEFRDLICQDVCDGELFRRADAVRRGVYGTGVYLRGLIEFTNHCKNDCYYCGIRRGNARARRYRLTQAEIMECCREGYRLGFRTFVLQGGEDGHFTDARMCEIVGGIRAAFPDCAITLSLGERSKESYRLLRAAGADRYLLRHETADAGHYHMLHPGELSLSARKQCLWDLKELGYQVGTGFMVGSPFQSADHLVADLRFLQALQPDMIGIGPFVPHADTPFCDMPGGTLQLTLRMIAILRLMFPRALIPSTTALGTIHPNGRELGLKAGANVVMPNLSPVRVRKWYALYDNKICTGEESAQCRGCLERRVRQAGYHIAEGRGDVRKNASIQLGEIRI